MKERKYCALCKREKFGIWVLTRDCTICRKQWKAFHRGLTPVSPLMRAITSEQIDSLNKEV